MLCIPRLADQKVFGGCASLYLFLGIFQRQLRAHSLLDSRLVQSYGALFTNVLCNQANVSSYHLSAQLTQHSLIIYLFMKLLDGSAGYNLVPQPSATLATSMSLKFEMNTMGKPKISDLERFPEMFAPNRKINRRECTRVVPMRILVLGMCRTGTACTNMSSSLVNPWTLTMNFSHVGSLEDAGIYRLLSVRSMSCLVWVSKLTQTSHSMMNLMIDPSDNDMWMDAINGKFFGGKPFSKQEWDMLLGHCQVNWPRSRLTFPRPPLDTLSLSRRSAISLPVPSPPN